MDFEPIFGNAVGMFQAWHAFVDLQVYPSVECELQEVVLGYESSGSMSRLIFIYSYHPKVVS